jgi:signal transduction histidine kinase
MSAADDDPRERLSLLGQIAAEIAHELQNVLQVISSSAFVARQEVDRGDAGAAAPHIAAIERNTRAAHAIVDDMMALARREPLASEAVVLTDLIAAARADLPQTGIRWHDALDPPDLRIQARPGLLVRLLHALYENAIQASAPRLPRIDTRARVLEGRVVLEIEDDGPGVTGAIAGRLFDPLVTGRTGGTGLGLSLARRIAAAHGGSIALVDGAGAAEGTGAARGTGGAGATFRVDLPYG